MSATRPRARTTDDGFSLVEVVVAISLVGIVAAAALFFFVNGTRSVTHQSRTQSAVVVATQAMEDAFAVSPKPVAKGAHTVPGLVLDRSEADVTAAWSAAAALGVQGLDDSYPVWDPAPTAGKAPAVPMTLTTRLESTEYTSTILVGACYRPIGSGDPQDCRRVGAGPAEPATPPANTVRLMRVMVHVSWPDVSGVCGDVGVCSYQAQSLVDPSEDIVWNNTTRPIAVDDVATVPVGGTIDVPVLLNDVIGPVRANPVTNLSAASFGTAVLSPLTGQVRYTAPLNASGVATFTYQIKDQAGHMSEVATVSVTVTGKAVDDAATAVRNVPVALDLLSNDQGSPTRIVIDTPPTGGATATVSPDGRTVTFLAPAVSTYTFRYHFTDGVSDSTQALVTVTVANYPAPIVADFVANVPATMLTTDFDIDMLGNTGNPAGYLFEIVSANVNQGRLKVDGPAGVKHYNPTNYKRGTRLIYEGQVNTLGTWTFQYRVYDPEGGQASAVRTVTLRIVPVGVDFSYTVRKDQTGRIQLSTVAGIAPTNFSGTVKLVDTRFPACVSDPGGQEYHNGIIKVKGKTKGNCEMWYQLVSPQDASVMSEPRKIMIKVN